MQLGCFCRAVRSVLFCRVVVLVPLLSRCAFGSVSIAVSELLLPSFYVVGSASSILPYYVVVLCGWFCFCHAVWLVLFLLRCAVAAGALRYPSPPGCLNLSPQLPLVFKKLLGASFPYMSKIYQRLRPIWPFWTFCHPRMAVWTGNAGPGPT